MGGDGQGPPARRGSRAGLWPAAALALLAALAAPAHAEDLGSIRTMLEAGRVAPALDALRRHLASNPEDVEGHHLRARAASRAGQMVESFQAFRSALGLRPGDPRLVTGMKGIKKPLVAELRASLARAPNDPDARHTLAFLLALDQKFDKAATQLAQLTGRRPDLAPGWLDLGWVQLVLGQRKAGRASIEKALELDPASPQVRRFFRLARELGDGQGPAPDRLYGLARAQAPAPAPTATAPATPPPSPSGPTPDFGAVDLSDDALVSSLLRRIEDETGGVDDPEAPPPDPGAPTAPDPTPAPGVVPTPLELVRKLEQSYREGEAALRTHRYEDAEKAFAFVVSVQPDYRDARRDLKRAERGADQLETLDNALLLLDAGDGKAAASKLRLLDASLIAAARPEVDVEGLRGDAAFLSGDWVSAESLLARAVPRSPEDAQRRYRLFRALAEQDKAAEALEQLAVLDKVAPGYARAQDGSTRLLLQLYVRKYFLLIAGLAGLWVLLAVGYVAFATRRKVRGDARATGLEDLQEALRAANWPAVLEAADALEANAEDPAGRARGAAGRITALFALGKQAEGEERLERFKREFSDDPSWKVLEGRRHLARRVADAETMPFLAELLRAEPGNAALLELMNGFYVAEGADHGEAREVLRRLLDVQPESLEHNAREAQFLLEAGELGEGAAAHFQRTLALDPTCAVALVGMGAHHAAAGRHLDALGMAKEALGVDPKQARARDLLLECCRELEMWDEGLRELERLEARGVEGLEPARAALEQGRSASQAADQAARDEEREVGGSYERGVRLFGEGRYAEAVPLLSEARQGASYARHAGALLIRCHLELGEVDRAKEAYQALDDDQPLENEFMVALCYDMAGALQRRGEDAAACDLFRRVCRADVDYRDAFERFEELQEQLNLAS